MRRSLSLASALALSLVVLVAPLEVTLAQAPTTIRVAGPPDEGFKDIFYGVQSGLFAKYGLDVQPIITHGGAAVLSGLEGGSYDVVYTNLVPVLQGHVRGLNFQVVTPSTMAISDHIQNAMVVAKDSPIRSARDLNGKTIGTQSLQDLNSIAMRAWIDKNGGDSSTVHLLEVPSISAVPALTSHRIDAMALSEPLLSEAVGTGQVRILAKPQTAIAEEFESQGFVASADYVAQHADAMARFVRAMRESALYNNAHEAATVGLVASFSAVPPTVIAHSVRSVDGDYVSAHYLQPLIDFAARYGVIARAFPADEIISPVALKPPKGAV